MQTTANLRAHPIAGLRVHTPRRGLTAADKAALTLTLWGALWALLIIATATLLAP